ncbi:MAG: tetratricopeptide repeat protein [Nitrospirae bacterium]|nr:tetratricopeptide repeat protein [Nitrospirota bacterium]
MRRNFSIIYTLIYTLLPIFIFSLLSGIAAASEGFYTIQTATYTPASFVYAKKHFNSLYEAMKDEDRNYLRIEQKNKYIVIRIGKFDDLAGAGKLLKKVKALAHDAFIVKAVDPEDAHIAKLYEKTFPVASSSDVPIKKSPALEEYYTLNIKNFTLLEQAANEFNALTKKMNEKDLDGLRIEKIGRYFSVRLGRFRDYASAKELLNNAGDTISEAVILKESRAEEQVISSYEKTPLPPIVIIEQSGNIEGAGDVEKNQRLEAEIQKREIELLIKDVSTQYGKEEYGKAAELLRKGIGKWPANPDIYAWYGATLLNMKYAETALQQYRKAVEISPDVPDYHAGVGLSLINIYMDRAKESIDAFQKALQIDPNNISALEGLGFVYASIGKKDLAVEMYNRLEPIDKAAALRLYQAITQEIDWEAR